MLPGAPIGAGGRILVIRGGAIGDFILTLPAIRLLRENFRDSQIEILGYPSIAQLALHWELADRVAALEHGALARFFVPGAELVERWSAYFSSFEVVISYLFDPDDYFHGNLRRAGVRLLLIGPHKPLDDGGPAALQLAKPLADLGLFLREDQARQPFVAAREPQEPGKTIALHPGSGSPEKNWGPEQWRVVCRDLATDTGANFLIISGEAEHETIREFTAALESDTLSYEPLHSRPLPEVAERLAGCGVFVGHDSGISHLAAACGLPCVLLFGPTNPKVWAPLQSQVEIIAAPGRRVSEISSGEVLDRVRAVMRGLRPEA